MTEPAPLADRRSRALARRIRAAPNGRAAHAALRPRGVVGPWRSRAPLWAVLLLADRDGRLVRDGDQVALRESRLEDVPPGRSPWHVVDRWWDVLCFTAPPLLLAVAVVVALVGGRAPAARVVGLAAVGGALLWVALLLLGALLRLMYRLVPRRPVEMASGQLQTLNPTVTLLHAATADGATELIARAVEAGPGPLLVLVDAITDAVPERHGPSGLRIDPLPEVPLLVARRPADPPPRVPTAPGQLRDRDAALMLGATVVMVAFLAVWVAEAERGACGLDCDGHPASYGDAVYWLLSRLLGGDPDGLGVSSGFGRYVGVLMTFFGLYVLVYIVGSVVRRRADDDLRSAADVTAADDASRGAAGGHPLSEPHDSGLLDVGGGQRLYWESCGNPAGTPAVVLHGGPGSGTGRHWTRLLDPAVYRIVLCEWARFRDAVAVNERDGDLVASYARLLDDPDPDVRDHAAREWCAWEERHVAATTGPSVDSRYADPAFRMRFARLVTHVWRHAAWLDDDALVVGAARLAGIPGVLIHGRADLSSPPEFAWRVHRAWPGSELHLVDGAGHGADDAMTRAIVEATDRLGAQAGRRDRLLTSPAAGAWSGRGPAPAPGRRPAPRTAASRRCRGSRS